MATTVRKIDVQGQIEWTGPTPTILDANGDNLVQAIYSNVVQPTADGAWLNPDTESYVDFTVTAEVPRRFGAALIQAPDPVVSLSGLTAMRMVFVGAHTDITASTPFYPMLFDSREASLAWADADRLLAAELDSDDVPGTYPAPGVVMPTGYVDLVSHGAAWAETINSGNAYAGFTYGGMVNTAVSTARTFWAYIELTYTTGSAPLRRYPPVNNGGFGPTRHYPRSVNRRAGGSY